MSDTPITERSYAAPSEPSTEDLRIAILGLGRAGQSLALEVLASDCHLVGLWNRGFRDVHPELDRLPIHRGGSTPPQSLIDKANVLILAVHDSAIRELAESLCPAPDTVILHLSGALAAASLGPLPDGIHGGCYHPLQSFRLDSDASSSSIPPYYVALDGSPRALAIGQKIAQATRHQSVKLAPEGKAAYHAAAVLTSGGMVALQSAAASALEAAGIPAEQRWSLLWPLAVGTLSNLTDGDFSSSLTGPVARGDAETTARNIQALADLPEVQSLYRVLGRLSLDEALKQGLGIERAEATRAVLKDD